MNRITITIDSNGHRDERLQKFHSKILHIFLHSVEEEKIPANGKRNYLHGDISSMLTWKVERGLPLFVGGDNSEYSQTKTERDEEDARKKHEIL